MDFILVDERIERKAKSVSELVEVVGFEELVDLRVGEGRARRLYDPNRVLQGKAGHLWRGRSNQFDPGEVFRTDDLAAKAGTCERISLQRRLGGRTITLNGSGIRECRFK